MIQILQVILKHVTRRGHNEKIEPEIVKGIDHIIVYAMHQRTVKSTFIQRFGVDINIARELHFSTLFEHGVVAVENDGIFTRDIFLNVLQLFFQKIGLFMDVY
jgi:hypothetical protein